MAIEKADKERRQFLKSSLGVATLLWVTPAILTLKAHEAHAQLSGGSNSGGVDPFLGSGTLKKPKKPKKEKIKF